MDEAGLILAIGRRDIIVGERVATAIDIGGVHDARIVVGDGILVVVVRVLALWLVAVD